MRTAVLLIAAGLVLASAPAATAAPGDTVVKRVKLQRLLKKDIKERSNRSVTVKCPRVKWRKGRVFYCRATGRRGEVYRVRVTLGNERKGTLRWRVTA